MGLEEEGWNSEGNLQINTQAEGCLLLFGNRFFVLLVNFKPDHLFELCLRCYSGFPFRHKLNVHFTTNN